jgi:hypothetical protein
MDTHSKLTRGTIPLACVFRLKELPGRLGKWLEVPPGRLGVILFADGSSRTYPPGRHRLLTTWERLRGNGAGLLAGYVPAQGFNAHLKAEYILSGDGVLLDASLVLDVQVADPVVFFREQVVPQGEISAGAIELGDDELGEIISALARPYQAVDLINNLPHTRLAYEAQTRLNARLQNQGLQAAGMDFISFWRSEERVVVASKIQALEERLQDVELQKKMAGVETQAQLREFIQQFEPGLGEDLGWQALIPDEASLAFEPTKTPQSSPTPTPRRTLGDLFHSWLRIKTAKPGSQRRARIEGLFGLPKQPVEKAKPFKTPRPPRYWWLGRAVWMGFVILAALVLSSLVSRLAAKATSSARQEIQLAIWGFAILAILESLKVIFEKREQLAEASFPLHGFTYINELVRNDRPRADQLVRQQASKELTHAQDILNETRRQVYQAGDTDQALRLRNLERKFEQYNQEVQRPDFGRPPYLSDLKISRRAWDDMLDYDEDLLLFANALSEKANSLQQKQSSRALNPALVASLESDLDRFYHLFRKRERAIELPENRDVSL